MFFKSPPTMERMLILLHKEDIVKLKQIADKEGTKKSILVRTAVKQFLRDKYV